MESNQHKADKRRGEPLGWPTNNTPFAEYSSTRTRSEMRISAEGLFVLVVHDTEQFEYPTVETGERKLVVANYLKSSGGYFDSVRTVVMCRWSVAPVRSACRGNSQQVYC